ncbi:M3 family metallopeptidase [Phenylobacterium sp.]|jgi:peptidyl-dipeptidase Dcp|uniref:M3 family metallopeptidase n=1 Tax=Phenylobacterium sp. TaxID=1871053 RepID=UPI000C96F87A|nr:M3 family metallopeptidase [Phenylobacterium sp.]MAK80670.1 peptidase M3 [Phenylobacterium sp.]|tara:strand:+ start:936 stop:3056 length:2121 start_codon:yes stop_codon:yes gene_type:complete
MDRRMFLAVSSAALGAAALPLPALAADGSPLLAPWTGPYGGVPPFDQVKIADFAPALEAAMALELEEIEAIANNPEPATFDNTIAALERAGAALDRVGAPYWVWGGTLSNPEMRAVETAMAPRLSAHSDKILQNAKLFARIEQVYEGRESAGLTPEQQRLTWKRWNAFVRAGAKLEPAAKARVAQINGELAQAFTTFSQNLLADETDYVLYLKTEAELRGLPEDVRAAAAAAATERGRPGEYAILNTRSSMDPFLTYSDRRDLREKVWRTYYSRGDNGDAHDNNGVIQKILKLRVERANLLGYPTHAHWRLEAAMAKTPDAAMELMMRVWPAAIARVAEEVAEMQAIADAEKAGVKIEPWDYRYYAEKVRAERYNLDMNEVKAYLQMDKLVDGMFWAAGEVYGMSFTPVTNVPVYHPDVRTWEVKRNGAHLGLFYFDPYARTGKRSGAWMNAYRSQQKLDGPITPIVSNNSNFVKGAPGQPVLISWDDATTLFHEFGHAIHGLLSNVTYPSLSGTSVPRDYVEFPSQVNEAWLPTREVLSRFALHHETGEPMPEELAKKIEQASTFRQGFEVTEYLASALIDMKLHLAGDADIDPDAFEREELAKLGMPAELPMRHRTPQFAHVFASDGYSAGYYSYLWAEVLSQDAAEAFREAPGGMYDKDVAKRMVDHILSVGDTVDQAEAYRAFRGRDAAVGAYLRDKGFPVS